LAIVLLLLLFFSKLELSYWPVNLSSVLAKWIEYITSNRIMSKPID